MSCDYEKTVLCHKRSVTFNRTMQLVEDPTADPLVPAFNDITGWKVHMTIKNRSGTEVIRMTSDEAGPAITITDGVNNIFTVVIPDEDLVTFPTGTLKADVLFYDLSDVRRATRTFLLKLEKEITEVI